MNFGGLDSEYRAYETAMFAVLPVPYDLTSTYQSGSRQGPAAILAASANMELYDEELEQETYRKGIYTAPPVDIDSRGPEYMMSSVERAVSDLLAGGKIPVMLGGEHSISFGAVCAMKKVYPKISVLHFDAHADMRDTYQGSPYSHACVARRIHDICPIVQVGIRSMSTPEAAFMKEKQVKTFSADFVLDEPNWIDIVSAHLSGDLYVSIDLDALDPAFMPATGTPEPGGISWRHILKLLQTVAKKCSVRGFDVVELSPLAGMVAPDFLAAKMIYRIMGYI
ncbi:MAG: agmatinase [Syntrophus sp. SKADARSKE-3]|nr:agmatinase [Syntrophus sp. SKADARSKE-3]